MSDQLDRKLRQIQGMLNVAEHPNTDPEEAENARNMADRLMAKYRIDEEEARQSALAQNLDTIVPIVMDFPVCRYGSEYRERYQSLMSACVRHVGNIRIAWSYDDAERIAIMVGFESDVKYAQTLFTELRLHFANTLEPQVDPNLSDEDNVYRLRSAGMERGRIGRVLWPQGRPKGTPDPSVLYKRACAARGEDPQVVGRSVNVKTYRKSFADGYVARIQTRLWKMAQFSGLDSTSMVLAGREEAVAEAFYNRFPQWRPLPEDRQIGESTIQGGPGGNCPKCLKAKNRYCRDHAWLKPRAYKEGAVSYLGQRAGQDAAESANLGGSSTGRIER